MQAEKIFCFELWSARQWHASLACSAYLIVKHAAQMLVKLRGCHAWRASYSHAWQAQSFECLASIREACLASLGLLMLGKHGIRMLGECRGSHAWQASYLLACQAQGAVCLASTALQCLASTGHQCLVSIGSLMLDKHMIWRLALMLAKHEGPYARQALMSRACQAL